MNKMPTNQIPMMVAMITPKDTPPESLCCVDSN